MNPKLLLFLATLLWCSSSDAAIRYVDLNNPDPAQPYTDWNTAAAVIQDAVDVAEAGDEIIVTNGIYSTGGRMMTNVFRDPFTSQLRTNVIPTRVMVTTALSLRSVNGPEFTEINGGGTDRCAYLTNGASLTGFCLRRGFADSGGGVYCTSTNAALTNCLITENVGGIFGGPWVSGPGGGGAYSGTFYGCILSSNTATLGGAVYASEVPSSPHQAALYNCVLNGNRALGSGGGAYGSSLFNCMVSSNSAGSGGGVAGNLNRRYALYNCQLIGNSASSYGGGANENCDLYNCLLTDNVAAYGGGASRCGLYNCTVTKNHATTLGGGSNEGGVYNSVIYYNTAPAGFNYASSGPHLYYCCTTPMPTSPGNGNITNEPLFLDWAGGDFRLQAGSPCINSASLAYNKGEDLDGNTRVVGGAPDIGAYEYQGASGGLLISGISASGADLTLAWRSETGRSYFVECSTNPVAPSYFFRMASNIMSGGGTTTWTHTNGLGMRARFYRVGVQ